MRDAEISYLQDYFSVFSCLQQQITGLYVAMNNLEEDTVNLNQMIDPAHD